MNKNLLGLVTVLYSASEVLPDFFISLGSQSYKDFKLYIIDNSPDDIAFNLAKKLSKKYSIETEFIKNEYNLGVAAANNQGINLALEDQKEYVLLLNNDIRFPDDTFESIVLFALRDQEKVVTSKILYAGTNTIWMGGGYLSKIKATTPHRGDNTEDVGQYDKIEYINYAPTCFMLVHKSVFSEVGMMDERYFVYYDDTDFVWRINKQGFSICYYPKVTIEHKVSSSTGGNESPFTIYFSNRNRLAFILKNYPIGLKLLALFYFFISRSLKFFTYNKEQRIRLMRGVKDGLLHWQKLTSPEV